MTEEERLACGAQEHRIRMDDIAAVKRGEMSLEQAQKRARKRSRQSGMTPHQSYSAMTDGSRQARRSPQDSSND